MINQYFEILKTTSREVLIGSCHQKINGMINVVLLSFYYIFS